MYNKEVEVRRLLSQRVAGLSDVSCVSGTDKELNLPGMRDSEML